MCELPHSHPMQSCRQAVEGLLSSPVWSAHHCWAGSGCVGYLTATPCRAAARQLRGCSAVQCERAPLLGNLSRCVQSCWCRNQAAADVFGTRLGSSTTCCGASIQLQASVRCQAVCRGSSPHCHPEATNTSLECCEEPCQEVARPMTDCTKLRMPARPACRDTADLCADQSPPGRGRRAAEALHACSARPPNCCQSQTCTQSGLVLLSKPMMLLCGGGSPCKQSQTQVHHVEPEWAASEQVFRAHLPAPLDTLQHWQYTPPMRAAAMQHWTGSTSDMARNIFPMAPV